MNSVVLQPGSRWLFEKTNLFHKTAAVKVYVMVNLMV
jgi:hypothetical protein